METLNLRASLPSGRSEIVKVSPSDTVEQLRKAVQKSLGRPFVRLAAPNGRLLDDPTESLERVGLQDGDEITAVAQQPKVATTSRAFALWYEAGSRVICWGNPASGANTIVADRVHEWTNVHKVCSTWAAFAAILTNGRVVTWGHPNCGGDPAVIVQGQLMKFQEIHATERAFAALRADGAVVTWGDPKDGVSTAPELHHAQAHVFEPGPRGRRISKDLDGLASGKVTSPKSVLKADSSDSLTILQLDFDILI
eukprot:Skav233832  [mRNA]  locus=scaffold2623:51345:53682:- [translate_table: standard]